MKNPVAMIGIGEMGGVFARGVLKTGHPVIPVTRKTDLLSFNKQWRDLECVIVAVAEKDIQNVLSSIPEQWSDKLVLLQNELLPRDWQQHKISNPTVISVWFEKKAGQDYKVLIPSPVFGPRTDLIKAALESLKIPVAILENEEDLLFELVLKNVYILTVNIAGMVVGGTVEQLWSQHQGLARQVADEVMDIQFQLIEKELNREKLIAGMLKAFEGDPQHKCMGRSAPARLERAIKQAQEARIPVKKLQEISAGQAKITSA